jgi:broad specificity phosphatase PhoE
MVATHPVRTRRQRDHSDVSLVAPQVFEKVFRLDAVDTTEVLLIRHAHHDWRAQSRDGDLGDPPLSEKGRQQALRLAQRLRGLPIDAVYSSTLRRAIETATLVAAAKDLPVVRVHNLREVEYKGVVEPVNGNGNVDWERLAQQATVRFLARPRWDSLPGYEPTDKFRLRVARALEGIIGGNPGRRVVVVTHGGVINAYLSMVLDIPRDMFFLAENTSISVVRALGGLCSVSCLNDSAHLQPTFVPR